MVPRNLDVKKFGTKNVGEQKKIGLKKVCVQNIFSQKIFDSRNIADPENNLLQRNGVFKNI